MCIRDSVIGEPSAIIASMDDELYGMLARLVALSPSGDEGLNALVRVTCAGALS